MQGDNVYIASITGSPFINTPMCMFGTFVRYPDL